MMTDVMAGVMTYVITGVMTGRCITSTQRPIGDSSTNTPYPRVCEVRAWCPVEIDDPAERSVP